MGVFGLPVGVHRVVVTPVRIVPGVVVDG